MIRNCPNSFVVANGEQKCETAAAHIMEEMMRMEARAIEQ